MNIKNKHFWSEAFHCVCITILAFLLTKIVVDGLMSLSVFSPVEKAADFQMSDLYQSVAEYKNVQQLSRDITIVAIDGQSRAEVLETINLISEYSPIAIGLDVFFPFPEQDNSYLLNTLTTIPNLVCAAKFAKDEGKDTWHHIKKSFYEDSVDVTYGYVNLNASTQRDVIRTFVPYMLTSTNDTLYSMPVQLAKISKPAQYQTLLNRNNATETIDYENIEFSVVSASEILSGEVNAGLLTGKIILVGDTGNMNDSYLSPLHNSMPGIMLHAYALQTIITDNYIDSTPTWLNWLIAFVLCILLTVCNLWSGYRRNIFVRIVQFFILYMLVVMGCAYFATHHIYIDFSLAILMIGLSLVAFDVWFGFVALYNFIKNKISRK